MIKKLLSLKEIMLICLLLLVGSFLQSTFPKVYSTTPFMYEFGLFHPWIRIYKDMDYGCLYLWECINTKGYLGVEFFPQYILLYAVLFNMGASLIKYNSKKQSLYIWMTDKEKDNSIVQFGCAMLKQILLMVGTGFIAAAVSFALRLGGYMNFFEPCIVALYLLLINLIFAFFVQKRKRNRSMT